MTLGVEGLTRAQAGALRTVLLGAVSGRRPNAELAWAVEAAPMGALPAAAALHRLGGTVLRGLDGVAGVPSQTSAALSAQRRDAGQRHLVVMRALRSIASDFDHAGLAWVVMKGPVVASRLYPDVGDRTYGDLDLLVSKRDFSRAMQILEGRGYVHSVHDWAQARRTLAGQVSMTHRGVAIDLHWHLHYSREDRGPFALDPEQMIDRARRVPVSGLVVPTFDAVDTLVALAFHAARSAGHCLMWYADVARAVAVDRPDLDELVRRVRACRCGPPVGVILERARWLLGAEVPKEVVDALVPASLRGVDRAACRLVHPIQLDERPTVTRWMTRSLRSSLLATIGSAPSRVARSAQRRLRPPPPNETDDPIEKADYLRAVATAEG